MFSPGLTQLTQLISFNARQFGSLSKRIYPWMDRQKAYWIDQKAPPGLDLDLTLDNSSFLKQTLIDEIHNKQENSSLLENTNTQWIPGVTQRVGLIGVKIGMYPLWSKKGCKLDCTIIQLLDNHALNYIPPEQLSSIASLKEPKGRWLDTKQIPSWVNHKRWGLQMVGAVSADPSEFSQEWNNIFEKYGVPTKRKITRFMVSPDAALKPGTPLKMNHFRVGDSIDITARTINRGFQGGIERWGMSGGPAGHGSTKFHRRVGSLAGGGKKVVRGKRMAGLMGNRFRTTRGKLIVRMNPRLGLIYVVGPTPGPVHSYCYLHDSWLCNRQRELNDNPPPVPTYFASQEDLELERAYLQEDFDNDFDFDMYHDMLHKPNDPSIVFK